MLVTLYRIIKNGNGRLPEKATACAAHVQRNAKTENPLTRTPWAQWNSVCDRGFS
jgi:hypothetical protein